MSSVQETYLKAIADAIREKEGSSDPILANEFAARILALQVVKKMEWVAATCKAICQRSVAFGNGKFVTIPGDPSITTALYSTDGINWFETTVPYASSWYDLTYGNGKFVAVPNSNNNEYGMYSTDGINWVKTNMKFYTYWQHVCYGNGRFVAMGGGGSGDPRIAYSSDGINWIFQVSNYPLGTIIFGNGKFITFASSKFRYSTDGIEWSDATEFAGNYFDVLTYGDGKYVALDAGTNVGAYSTDGINWTKCTLPVTANWKSVCYGNGLFIAVAYTTNTAIYSKDGINWYTIVMPKSAGWSSVAYGDGKFVAMPWNSSSYAYLKW